MSSKTKILLLKKRELIYTLLFAALAVILIVLMIWMFLPAGRKVLKPPLLFLQASTPHRLLCRTIPWMWKSGLIIPAYEVSNCAISATLYLPCILPYSLLWISWPARSVTASLWKISIMKKAVSILPRCCWMPSVQHWNWPEKFNPLSQAIQLFFPDLYAGITRHT